MCATVRRDAVVPFRERKIQPCTAASRGERAIIYLIACVLFASSKRFAFERNRTHKRAELITSNVTLSRTFSPLKVLDLRRIFDTHYTIPVSVTCAFFVFGLLPFPFLLHLFTLCPWSRLDLSGVALTFDKGLSLFVMRVSSLLVYLYLMVKDQFCTLLTYINTSRLNLHASTHRLTN